MGIAAAAEKKDDLYIIDVNLGDARYYERAIEEMRLNESVGYIYIGLNAMLKKDCIINGKTGKTFRSEEMLDLDMQCYNLGALM
jgi:hypothetical protein